MQAHEMIRKDVVMVSPDIPVAQVAERGRSHSS